MHIGILHPASGWVLGPPTRQPNPNCSQKLTSDKKGKRVFELKREAYKTMPKIMQDFANAFKAKRVLTCIKGTVLPPAFSISETHDPGEAERYLSYVRDLLDSNMVDKHVALSLLAGLRACGEEGKELSEWIKKNIK